MPNQFNFEIFYINVIALLNFLYLIATLFYVNNLINLYSY